jgi:tetratricopeptide (TPR) repeat protein
MRRLRNALIALLCVTFLLAAGGAVVAVLGLVSWGHADWYYRSGPDYRLRCGKDALAKSDPERVEQIALLLDADGYKDHAALLRAEASYAQAKPRLDRGDTAGAEPLLQRAVADLRKIRDQGPLRLEAAELSGKCSLFLHAPFEAARAFEFVLSENPDSIDAHRGLEALYYDQGAFLLAIDHAEQVAQLDPEDGRPYRHMGRIFHDLGEHGLAVGCYEKALGRNLHGQSPAIVRKELAESLLTLKRYREALDALRDVEPAAEDVAAIEALRAECLRRMGQTSEMRALLDRSLASFANAPDLLRLRAELCLEDNDPARAVKLLEHAVAADPYDYTIRYQLMLAYQRLEKKADADEQKRHADELLRLSQEESKLTLEAAQHPWDAAVRRQLGEICEKLGKLELAAMWRQAATACPPAPAASKVDAMPAVPPQLPR